jgi:hypothetical protein
MLGPKSLTRLKVKQDYVVKCTVCINSESKLQCGAVMGAHQSSATSQSDLYIKQKGFKIALLRIPRSAKGLVPSRLRTYHNSTLPLLSASALEMMVHTDTILGSRLS